MDLLLDTNALIRWFTDKRRLSKEQLRLLELSVNRRTKIGISAITIVELAYLFGRDSTRFTQQYDELILDVQDNPIFEILPITYEIGSEIAALGNVLSDPMDRTIVATARVHNLRLLTADQRILESKLARSVG